jgi:hypothetical protein
MLLLPLLLPLQPGVEVDWVSGGDIIHVDMNVFSSNDWKLSWLLLVPAVNYVKGWIR